MRRLSGVVAIGSLGLLAPASAHAESLSISFGATPAVGQPLSIAAAGVADGAHRLYAYADPGGYGCASAPYAEYARSGVLALSSATGDPLAAGSFRTTYTYTPTTGLFTVCGYLDATPAGPPDAVGSDSSLEDPVNKYLENEREAQPIGESNGTSPGAIEPLPVNPQVEREYWERVAREARTGPEREHAEDEAQRAGLRSVHCVVPLITGDSLRRATRALTRAHCKLGRVSGPRRGRQTLVVLRQHPGHGRKLQQGAAISIGLGPRGAR